MFENLKDDASGANNPNSGNNSQATGQVPPNQPDVDDIFAETDTSPNHSNDSMGNKSEIVTKHVGLGASANPSSLNDNGDDEEDEKKGGKTFTIIVVIMVIVIVGLLGYLVYSKFFQADEAPVVTDGDNIANEVEDEEPADEENGTEDDFEDYEPLQPGEEEEDAFMEDEEPEEVVEEEEEPAIPVDSDGDGLTDDEELRYGTNPLLIDTDGDGLSDYEEVVIYKSDPLNADTDDDGYTDGEEVNNGYNPNGPGLLTDK